MINQECAICGSGTPFSVLYPSNFKTSQINKEIFSARRKPDRCHYRLVRCNNCGLIYSNPIFEENKINNLYIESELTYDEEIDNLKKTYGYYLKQSVGWIPAKNNLLEIGCGNGFFLEEALEQRFKNVWGVEPSISAVAKAPKNIRKKIITDIFRPGIFKDNYFDIICIFQTLDHIIDPNGFLKNCFKILKKGGVVLCIVHNSNSLLARLMAEKTPIFDIEHTYLYNKKTLRKIFEINNFRVVDEINVANQYSLRYWLRLLPLGKPLKALSEKLLQIFNLQGKTLKMKAGNLGMVAGKPR